MACVSRRHACRRAAALKQKLASCIPLGQLQPAAGRRLAVLGSHAVAPTWPGLKGARCSAIIRRHDKAMATSAGRPLVGAGSMARRWHSRQGQAWRSAGSPAAARQQRLHRQRWEPGPSGHTGGSPGAGHCPSPPSATLDDRNAAGRATSNPCKPAEGCDSMLP